MLLLLLAQMVLSNQQAHFVRLPFLFGWAAFLLVAGIAMILSWIVASLYYGQVMSGAPLLLQALLTVGAYPVAGWVFGRLDAVLER
ncbi:MAG: hypothetical protein D6807_00770 [Alphaproteobacteria bacterium]|nr:MAG: hypothetical protein D6807_00770 [Alphaproteobacteria bacterium]